MLIDLVGVLEDGGPRGAGVPGATAQLLRLPVGVDATVRLRVVRASGPPADLAGGSLVLTVKRRATDVAPALAPAGVLGGERGTATFSLVPADTRGMRPGRYVYDVWYTSPAGKRDPLVPLGPLVLLPAATLPP